MKGRNKYLTKRKSKHFGFLTKFGFQLKRFCYKLSGRMPESWILNKLFTFVSLFFVVLKLVNKALGVNVSIKF